MSKNPHRVAVLTTAGDDHYILSHDPSEETVRAFAAEQNRRVEADIPAGPSGLIAQRVVSAHYWASQTHFIQGKAQGKREISLDD